MSLLNRLFNIGQAEANAVVDKMEDPVLVTEQEIRNMSGNLQQALNGEAEAKAIALGHRADQKKAEAAAAEWEKKANDLLDAADHGQLDSARANLLAEEAAVKSQKATAEAANYKAMADREEQAVDSIAQQIKKLRDKVEEAQNTLEMLKARAKTAQASEQINKALSSVNVDGSQEVLKRMEAKVSAQEFRAQAYSEIDNATTNSETEINNALNNISSSSALDAIRAKRAAKNAE